MPRVNTVTNALKRFFSRDDNGRSPNNTPDGKDTFLILFNRKFSIVFFPLLTLTIERDQVNPRWPIQAVQQA